MSRQENKIQLQNLLISTDNGLNLGLFKERYLCNDCFHFSLFFSGSCQGGVGGEAEESVESIESSGENFNLTRQ